MRWLRHSPLLTIMLFVLILAVYFSILGWVFPLLWPYRDQALVRVLLDLISGGHLPDILHEIGSPI